MIDAMSLTPGTYRQGIMCRRATFEHAAKQQGGSMSSVSFRKLEKTYGALRIVKGIDLEIADRDFVVLVGPSG